MSPVIVMVNILILLCYIILDRRSGCSNNCSTSAGLMQCDALLMVTECTAQLWKPSDLCCIQRQSILIKLWDAAGLMWLLRFQSSCSSLQGVNPLLFLLFRPFTMITLVSTQRKFAFAGFSTRSYKCWESDLWLLESTHWSSVGCLLSSNTGFAVRKWLWAETSNRIYISVMQYYF